MSQTATKTNRLIDRFDRAVVVGLGTTGYSAACYLRKKGLEVGVVDSRSKPVLAAKLRQKFPEVKAVFGDFTSLEAQQIIDFADLFIVSPGVPLSSPMLLEAKRRGAMLVGDVELFLQDNSVDVIAITGSNGKSTVTTLVGAMSSAAGRKPLVAGNIGLPVLDALIDGVDYDLAVLELSSFQLESTRHVGARSAAILNISADHMDRYALFGDYVLAKARVLKGSKIAVLPSHDNAVAQITTNSEVVRFSLHEPELATDFGIVRIQGRRWLVCGKQKLMRLSDVPLVGLHNVSNVLASFALLKDFKLDVSAMVDAVKAFHGLDHRMQTIANKGGVLWVNDSKATNIGAAMSALNSLEQNIIWIAGGDGKDADFSELEQLDTQRLKHLITLGKDGPQIAQALHGKVEQSAVSTMCDAVNKASEFADKGDLVLLSPACASFDMYENYMARGDEFIRCVEALEQGANLGGVAV